MTKSGASKKEETVMLCRQVKKQQFKAVREDILTRARTTPLSPILEIDFHIDGTHYILQALHDERSTIYALSALRAARQPDGAVAYTMITDNLLLNALTDLLLFQSLSRSA